jgi:hypothetical protein
VARICPPRVPKSAEVTMPDFAARAKAIFGARRTRLTQAVLREREASRW